MDNGTNDFQDKSLLSLTEAPREIDNITGKYVIKPTKKTWLANIDPKHDGAVMFSRTFAYISPEVDKDTGLIKTGLTDKLARELEREMNLTQGTLSPYNKTYWSQFKINTKVEAEGTILDCDRSALDKLRYCYLRVSSKIAKNAIEALENPLCEYILTSPEMESKSDSEKAQLKRSAYKKLESLNFETQFDFLLVYKQNKYKVSKASTADAVIAAIGKVVDEDPEGFLTLIENPNFRDYVFLRKCIAAGFLRQQGPSYLTLGGDVLGNSFEQAIYNLKSPEYNNIKVNLLAKLDGLTKA